MESWLTSFFLLSSLTDHMGRITDRVAARYAAEMQPEKMQELLLKIRKGAISSVSMKQFILALNYLGGWKIEPFVGLVQIHGYPGKEDTPEQEAESDAQEVQLRWEKAKSYEVPSLPSQPTPGKRYTMDVTLPSTEGWATGLTGFKYRSWLGAKGIRFTTPEGKIFELLPGKYDLTDHRGLTKDTKTVDPFKIPLYVPWPWFAKETNLKEQAANSLGLKTHEQERQDSKPRTRLNTGTCPCCFRNIKLKARGTQLPIIVLHGYERPGWGNILGECLGVSYPPFELSPEGTKHLVKMLRTSLAKAKDNLARLKSGEITEFYDLSGRRKLTPESMGPVRWRQLVEEKVSKNEDLVTGLEHDIKMLSKLISDWKEQPLPFEGDKIKPPPAFLR